MRWKSGRIDRSGMAKYVHLVRAPGDPSSTPNGERERDYTARWLRDLKVQDPFPWRGRIVGALTLAGERPLSFQAICVRLINRDADACHETPLEEALWSLVEDRILEHTMGSPVFFRIIDAVNGKSPRR